MPGTGDQRWSPIGSANSSSATASSADTRHELRRDRITIVAGIDQRRHVLGHGDRELIRDAADLVVVLGNNETGGDKIIGK